MNNLKEEHPTYVIDAGIPVYEALKSIIFSIVKDTGLVPLIKGYFLGDWDDFTSGLTRDRYKEEVCYTNHFI